MNSWINFGGNKPFVFQIMQKEVNEFYPKPTFFALEKYIETIKN